MRGNFFIPSSVLNIPAVILKAKTEKINGVNQTTYEEGSRIFLGARNNTNATTTSDQKTSEKKNNNTVNITTTMNFTGYYNPELTGRDRIKILTDNTEWEVVGDVENVNLRGLFMRFTARTIHG